MKPEATLAAVTIMAVAACIACAIALCEQREQIAAESAVITSLYGTVQVRHGVSGWKKAEVNAVLKAGDAVRTSEDSRAEVTVAGGGHVRLDENTHLLIRHISGKDGTTLKALIGNVWVSIERVFVGAGGFRIEMPSAVAAVKGTVFQCSVDDAGACGTSVYDGEVSCEAEGEVFAVRPAREFAIGRGIAARVADMDLDRDAARDWVVWNRRKDLLHGLGNPKVFLASVEYNGTGRQKDPAAQRRLLDKLTRAGFEVRVLSPDCVPDQPLSAGLDWAFGDSQGQGALVNGEEGIVLAAEFEAEMGSEIAPGVLDDQAPPRPGDAGLFASRGNGRARILDPKTRRAVHEWDARRPGHGRDQHGAGRDVLMSLGDRLGDEIVPQLLDAMIQRQAMARVAVGGITGRRQMFALSERLRARPEVSRVHLLGLSKKGGLLGVATSLNPSELASWLQECTNGGVQVTATEGALIAAEVRPGFDIGGPAQRAPAGAMEPNRPGARGYRPRQERGSNPRSGAAGPRNTPPGAGARPRQQGR